jgi:hypothetical protein
MAEWIFMKCDIVEFYKNLSTHSNFGQNQTTIMGTLHENLDVFLLSEVTGWGIPG